MMMKKYSAVYKRGKHSFRYDFENCIVEHVFKAGKSEIAENEEWMAEFGHPLWEIDESGYVKLDGVGLRPENWKRKAVRDEYLDEWIMDMEEEFAFELSML